MSANMLKLNTDKTELLLIHSRYRTPLSLSDVKVGNDTIVPAQSAKNIGVVFDNHMNFNDQIKDTCKACFYKIHLISKIRRFLSKDNTATLVHTLVTSKLDYCNSLLYGLPDHLIHQLQLVQNCSARLIMQTRKYDHIKPALKDLHWLPIRERIAFKILLITFKSLNGLAPSYIRELLEEYTPGRQLRSVNKCLLKIPSTSLKTYGDRAFSSSAPKLWNSIPLHIRNSTNLNEFKTKLKTFLFKKAYS